MTQSRPSRPRVLIIDDHRLFADVITSTLKDLELDVIGPAWSASQGLAMARRERPELVLVDLGLPDESGLAVGKRILDEQPEARVVVVTSLADHKAVNEAMRLGFHGYVTKDVPIQQFVSSIQAVLDGHVVVPKHLARGAAGVRTAEEHDAAMLIEQLTDREQEVLTLLAEGAATNEIARQLSISPNTVRTHVQHLLSKLQLHSRLQAAAFAVRHGMIVRDRR